MSNNQYKFKIIKKSEDSFVVVNTTLDTHAHLPTYKGCLDLIRLIRKGEYIRCAYLRNAKERLIPKKKRKDRYVDKHFYKCACGRYK